MKTPWRCALLRRRTFLLGAPSRAAIRAFCHSAISGSSQPTDFSESVIGLGNLPAAIRA